MMKRIFLILLVSSFFACKNNSEPEKETSVAKRGFEKPVSHLPAQETTPDTGSYPKISIDDPVNVVDGEHTQYYPSGKVKAKGSYKNGKRDGHWVVFFESGVLWTECIYKEGVKDGMSAVYYSNGKKRYEGEYRNDKRVGEWSYYDAAGSLVKKEVAQ
jgi:hypothetical protein